MTYALRVDANVLIAAAVFIYFAIGGVGAAIAAMANRGFTGRYGWEPFVIFFAWPLGIAARLGPGLYFVGGLSAAAAIAWLVWLALPH